MSPEWSPGWSGVSENGKQVSLEKVILAGERGGGGTVGVPIAATDNELITRDGGVGARNAGAARKHGQLWVGNQLIRTSKSGPSLL